MKEHSTTEGSTYSNDRTERGVVLWQSGHVLPTSQTGSYWVFSSSRGIGYDVSTPWAKGGPSCTCPDHDYRHTVCKHIVAASLEHASKLVRERIARGQDLRQIEDWLVGIGCAGVPTEHETAWQAYWTATQQLLEKELRAA